VISGLTDLTDEREALTDVWLVLPTYNEAENLALITRAALDALPAKARILIVDDSSPDGTGAIADGLALNEDRIEVLHRVAREGLGPAYLAGFEYALRSGARFLCQMDADFSHDPRALPALLDGLADADVVLGSRYVSGGSVAGWGALRRLISRAGSKYSQFVLRLPIQDPTGGFKAFRGEVLKELSAGEIAAQGYVFQIEMTYRAWKRGYRISELPITFRERQAGKSKMSIGIALEATWRVPLLRWRLRGVRSGRSQSIP